MLDPVADLIVRTALAWLMAAAAWHKRRDPVGFRQALAAYEVWPAGGVAGFAVAVPVAEAALAAALVAPGWRLVGLFGTAAVLSAYAVAMGVNLWRGRRDLDCGCGGTPTPIGPWLIGRNLALAAVAVLASAPVASRPLSWVDGLSVVAATLALAACWLAAEGLLALQPAVARLRGER